MPLGTSMVLIAIGAVLKYAVTWEVAGIDLRVVGTILLVIGIVGLIISLIFMFANRDGGGRMGPEQYPREQYPRDRYR
jgi:hypothetical protein